MQIFVARRDNARAIFRSYLEQQGNDLHADRCCSVLAEPLGMAAVHVHDSTAT